MNEAADNPLPPADAPEFPGYRVVRQVGQGGMATVYLAVQNSLDRRVAIKLMLPMASADEQQARRFEQEARTIARLEHPNIVSIYEVGRTELGRLYYVMAYLPRGDLSHRDLTRDQRSVIAVLRALLDALAYAHARGVVHRDVKAENVLFDSDDRAMLADFGIALSSRVVTRLTGAGMTLGSGGYMAPEQSRGERVDARADLYSVGVLAYEMLLGELPFQANDPLALAMKHGHDPIPRMPRQFAHWQPFIDRALAKQPGKRYRNAQAMRAALDAVEKRADGAGATVAERWYRLINQPFWRSVALRYVIATALLAALTVMVWRSPEPAPTAIANAAMQESQLPTVEAGDEDISQFEPATSEQLDGWIRQLGTDPAASGALSGVDAHYRWLAQQIGADFARGEDDAIPGRYAEARAVATTGQGALDAVFAVFQAQVTAFLESQRQQAVDAEDSQRADRATALLAALGLSAQALQPTVETLEPSPATDPAVSNSARPPVIRKSTRPRIGDLVSRGDYQRFAEATGREESRCRARLSLLRIFDRRTWQDPGFKQTAKDPVVCVSPDDARAYLAWASRRDGVRYRLPTPSEQPRNSGGFAEWTGQCVANSSGDQPCAKRIAAGPLAQRQILDSARGFDDVGFRAVID